MADDDSWLYGEDTGGGDDDDVDATNGDEEMPIASNIEDAQDPVVDGDEMPTNANLEDGNGSGSEDSDDDGIQVTIDKDKIEAAKTTYQTMQLKKNSVIDLGFVASHKEKKGKFAVEVCKTSKINFTCIDFFCAGL